MKKISTILFITILAWMNFSCNGKKTEESQPKDEGLIEITPEQFKTGNMALGQLGSQTFQDKVACKGYIFAPANAMAKVSTPIAGKVNTIKYKIGDYVSAGQTIATISGNDFMELQQNFAEAAASYSKAKVDYERAQSLWDEKIGAQKDFLAAKSIYKSAYASYLSLKSRITTLRLNASQIENGRMYTSFPVTSPISGYLTKTNAVIGQFIDMENDIAEIVNINALQLRLAVYESDINQLKTGQTVMFGTAGNANKSLRAKLVNIGKSINSDTKTIDCIANIDKSTGASLINESFVEASIAVSEKQVMALPSTAIQKEGSNYYVYVVEKMNGKSYMLKKTIVNIGATEKDYTEIRSELPNKEIIVRGIETLQ